MLFLEKYLFTAYDQTSSGFNWPGWHYVVLLLYAGQMAINYCDRPAANGFFKDKLTMNLLDFFLFSAARKKGTEAERQLLDFNHFILP